MIILGRQKDFCYRYGWERGGGLGRVNVIRSRVGPTVAGMLSDYPSLPYLCCWAHTLVPQAIWCLRCYGYLLTAEEIVALLFRNHHSTYLPIPQLV